MTEDDTSTATAERSSSDKMFRGIGKHALIYAVGMVMSRAVSFVMLPIYTRYLTPADYGVMALVEMTLDFIAIIGGGNLALGVFRFYHKTEDESEKREVVSTSFMLVGVLYFVVGAAVFASAGLMSALLFGSDAQVTVIRVAALNLAAGSLMIVPMTYARVKDRSVLFVGANMVKLILAVGLNLLFIVVMGLGVVGIFLSSLIASSVVGLALVVWLWKNVGRRPSTKWTRNLLRYGVPLMGMQVATFIATFSDRYFLQAAGDEAVVGLYSLAYQFGFLMVMIGLTPMEMVWGPKRFEIAKRDDKDHLLARGFTLLNILMFMAGVGITLFVADVLRIMSTEAFHSAAAVVPVILVAYVFQAWAAIQDIGILVEEQTRYLAIINAVSAAVAVIGYALLVPPFLEWGAAGATVISFSTRYVLTYRVSQRLWPVVYEWRPVLVLVAWSVFVGGGALLLPQMALVSSLAVRTVLFGVFVGGVWVLPVMEPSDKAAVRELLGRVLGRASA